MVIFVVLGCHFLTIRQQYLLEKLTKLNDKISKNFQRKFKVEKLAYLQLIVWKQFTSLNKNLANLCVDVKLYSDFWKVPISVYFAGYITLQCYLAYITFFMNTLPFLEQLFFAYALLVVELLLYTLLYMCARVAKINGKLERANRKFYLNFSYSGGFTKVVNRLNIFQAERLQVSGRLRPFAIVLLDNYRITVDTFYLVCFCCFSKFYLF